MLDCKYPENQTGDQYNQYLRCMHSNEQQAKIDTQMSKTFSNYSYSALAVVLIVVAVFVAYKKTL